MDEGHLPGEQSPSQAASQTGLSPGLQPGELGLQDSSWHSISLHITALPSRRSANLLGLFLTGTTFLRVQRG
jgi:hypothetical protein